MDNIQDSVAQKHNDLLKDRASSLLGQCKVLSQDELQRDREKREREQNTVMALRLLSTLHNDLYMGSSLNSFQKEVIALCKTQL